MIENDIQKWETENNIKLPTIYREWLLFSEESLIRNDLAHFYRLDDFKYNVIDVSPDLIVIGEIFGDGELICLSIRVAGRRVAHLYAVCAALQRKEG